jgi:hypothetical protein
MPGPSIPDFMNPDTIVEQPIAPLDVPSEDQTLTVREPASVAETLQDGVINLPSENVNDDIITLSIKDDELPDAVLKAVLLGLAEEQFALKAVREKKQKENRDISHLSLKRGTLLKYMSETLIQRQALVGGTGEIDLKGPKFREVMKMFLTIIADTFDEIKIPPEYRDLFFQTLARNMEGWESKAEKILKTIR